MKITNLLQGMLSQSESSSEKSLDNKLSWLKALEEYNFNQKKNGRIYNQQGANGTTNAECSREEDGDVFEICNENKKTSITESHDLKKRVSPTNTELENNFTVSTALKNTVRVGGEAALRNYQLIRKEIVTQSKVSRPTSQIGIEVVLHQKLKNLFSKQNITIHIEQNSVNIVVRDFRSQTSRLDELVNRIKALVNADGYKLGVFKLNGNLIVNNK